MNKGSGGSGSSSSRSSFFDLLVDDVISEIFIRVPAKSLVRSTCVCKRWKTLISDKTFVSLLPPLMIGFFYSIRTSMETRNYEPKFLTLQPSSYSSSCEDSLITNSVVSYLKQFCYILTSHNELLLLANKFDENIYSIYIPLKGQHFSLPRRPDVMIYINSLTPILLAEDFYHFKVVCFKEEERRNEIEITTYSSEEGRWKDALLKHNLNGGFWVWSHYILGDGSVYVLMLASDLIPSKRFCRFDLNELSLLEVELPCTRDIWGEMHNLVFDVCCGSLYCAQKEFDAVHVWVLVDGVNWLMKYNIDCTILRQQLQVPSDVLPSSWSLAFHPLDPEVVFIMESYQRMRESPTYYNYKYHLNTKRIEFSSNYSNLMDVIPYVLPLSVCF